MSNPSETLWVTPAQKIMEIEGKPIRKRKGISERGAKRRQWRGIQLKCVIYVHEKVTMKLIIMYS